MRLASASARSKQRVGKALTAGLTAATLCRTAARRSAGASLPERSASTACAAVSFQLSAVMVQASILIADTQSIYWMPGLP
jgi:hypothetical protein